MRSSNKTNRARFGAQRTRSRVSRIKLSETPMRLSNLILFSVAIVAACSTGANTRAGKSEHNVVLLDSVVLQRTVCFGRCPAYRLRISSDGTVLFSPENPPGETAQANIPPAAFVDLAAKLEDAGFYSYPSVIQAHSALWAVHFTDHPKRCWLAYAYCA